MGGGGGGAAAGGGSGVLVAVGSGGRGVSVGGTGSGGGSVGGGKVGLLVGLGGIERGNWLAAVGVKVGKRVRVGEIWAASGCPRPGNEAQARLTSRAARAMGLLKP